MARRFGRALHRARKRARVARAVACVLARVQQARDAEVDRWIEEAVCFGVVSLRPPERDRLLQGTWDRG